VDTANEGAEGHSGSAGTPAHVTCEQITSWIVDYVTGVFDDDTTRAFEAHLHACRDCIAFLNTYRKTIQTVRTLADVDVPGEMVLRVRQFISQQTGSNRPNR
jgi:anti-sigma factor RsiW